MMRGVAAFMIIICSLSAKMVSAQPSSHFEAGAVGGFLMPHHNDMLYLIDGHIKGLEVAWHRTTDGSKDWHHHFNFPTWGVEAAWHKLSSNLLGEAVSAHAFLNLPLDRQRRCSIMMGLGGGYITNPFDMESNFQNSAIGSHLNASLEVTALRQWNLSPRLRARAGIGIRHFSNGAMRMPNSGINLAVAKISFQYLSLPENLPERRRHEFVKERWQTFAGISAGAKETLPLGSGKHGVVNLFGSWQKRISPKSSWGLEAGINYNSSLEFRTAESGDTPSATENFRPFAALQYLIHFGPLALRFQGGSYIFPSFTDDGLVFFRYHLVYEASRFQIFTGLKSHFAKADNIELGLAYRLK